MPTDPRELPHKTWLLELAIIRNDGLVIGPGTAEELAETFMDLVNSLGRYSCVVSFGPGEDTEPVDESEDT